MIRILQPLRKASSLRGAAWTAGALSVGYWAGVKDKEQSSRSLPSGWRACCDAHPLSAKQKALAPKLAEIVGEKYVQSDVEQKGSRVGKGVAHAVVKPGSIKEALDVLQACVDADACILPQGANTGLTGGSVPRGHEHGLDRPTVVISLSRLKSVMPIDNGEKLVCLAGAGIYDVLTKASEFDRESHSVLGSIFLNPTTAAGVAFGSGGTQTRKGPVYTERLLYARVNEQGKVELCNSLGLRGDGDELYAKLEAGAVTQDDVVAECKLPASQTSYRSEVCTLDGRVARFNADVRGPDACRSEGKVLILASVHDTFPKPTENKTLWVSCKSLELAHKLKKEVNIAGGSSDVPPSCEYMDKDSCRAVDEAGRVACWVIGKIGIGPLLKSGWDLKLKFESLPLPFAGVIPDKVLFLFNGLFPNPLPPKMARMTQDYDHHMLISVGEYGGGELERFMSRLDKFTAASGGDVAVYSCTNDEKMAVTYFRFTAASAFRTWCVGSGLEGISTDYALPLKEVSAPALDEGVVALRMRYSHFGCNVVHEDVAFKRGVDAHWQHEHLKHLVEEKGGKLPAEHGHGTEYHAPEETQKRWKKMDPLNVFNPGVGGLSTQLRYGK